MEERSEPESWRERDRAEATSESGTETPVAWRISRVMCKSGIAAVGVICPPLENEKTLVVGSAALPAVAEVFRLGVPAVIVLRNI